MDIQKEFSESLSSLNNFQTSIVERMAPWLNKIDNRTLHEESYADCHNGKLTLFLLHKYGEDQRVSFTVERNLLKIGCGEFEYTLEPVEALKTAGKLIEALLTSDYEINNYFNPKGKRIFSELIWEDELLPETSKKFTLFKRRNLIRKRVELEDFIIRSQPLNN